MAKLNLNRDVTINGNVFKAGKDINTEVTDIVDGKAVKHDYADAIKEQLERAKRYDEFASTHHGAVDYHGPNSFDPDEAPDTKKGNN